MLERKGSWELPLREASALAVRRDPVSAAFELLSLDDEGYLVDRAGITNGRLAPRPDPYNVTDAVVAVGVDSAGGSNFEAVASDASGRLFIVQEGDDRILVSALNSERSPAPSA